MLTLALEKIEEYVHTHTTKESKLLNELYKETIEFILGNALKTLTTLKGPFDLVFIDADKANYINYFEECLPKVRSGGLIVVDNVLWSGRVLNPKDEDSIAIDKFNKHIACDRRVEVVMLTIRDGVTLARKL